jgi:hypothetical protein
MEIRIAVDELDHLAAMMRVTTHPLSVNRDNAICLRRYYGADKSVMIRVAAESHCPHIYPQDKLDLAISRMRYLMDSDYRKTGSYHSSEHRPYQDKMWLDD